MKRLTLTFVLCGLVLLGCSRKTDNPAQTKTSQQTAEKKKVTKSSASDKSPDVPTDSSPPSNEGPAAPRLDEWAFTQQKASSVELAFQDDKLSIATEGSRLLARARPPMGVVHLVHRKRLVGDFTARIRVRMPARKDTDVQQKGGTAIPYFGFRSLDGKRLYTAPAPQLVDEPLDHELKIERVGGTLYFSVDGQPRKGNAPGTSLDGHVFLHLNPPSKVWIAGFDVNSDSTLYDFGVPKFVAIDMSPQRWVYSTGGSDPQDIQDPGTLKLAVDNDGFVLTKVDMKGTSAIRHLEKFDGDFHFQAELELPTVDESGGYRSRSGAGANIEFAFRPEPSQTGGARHSINLTEHKQSILLAMKREGDMIQLLLDGRRAGNYRFPGSENPGHFFLNIGGVGSVRVKRLEKVSAGQPAPGASLAGGGSPPDQGSAGKVANWVNLLGGLDLKQQTLRGSGHLAGTTLVTDAGRAPALIRTSHTAPKRYELRAMVTRSTGKGAIYFLAPIEGRPCAVIIEAENDGAFSSGLALIDNMAPKNPKYPAKAYREQLLPIGKRSEIICRVDGNQFELIVNGKRIFNWSGDTSRLTLTPFFRSKYPQHVMVGSALSTFQVHAFDMRPLAKTEVVAKNPKASPKDSPSEIVSFEDWYVPATTNKNRDSSIEQDMALARDSSGIKFSKTKHSGVFWLFRKPPLEGDFLVTMRIVMPSLKDLGGWSGSGGRISLGVHPTNRRGQIFTIGLPSPLQMDPREVVVQVQRVGREITARIEGQPSRPPGNLTGPVNIGVRLRDDAHFWLAGFDVKSASSTGLAQQGSPDPAAGEIEEFKLPAPVDNATTGFGGRFLIMHIKPLFKLAVFDIETSKIVKYIPVSGDRVFFAAGAAKLIVVQPDEGTISRWDLASFERELTASFSATHPVTDVAMGQASSGPIVVSSNEDGVNHSDIQFVDLQTLKKIKVEVQTKSNFPPRWNHVFAVRASADGRVFGICSFDRARVLALSGNRSQLYEETSLQARFASPGPLGQVIYTDAGLVNTQLKPLKQDGISRVQPTVPATRGPFYLTVDAPVSYTVGDTLLGTVSLQLPPHVTPIATFKDLRLKGTRGSYFRRDGGLSLDRRLIFHPPAGRIVAIADERDRLLIKKIDLDALLKRAKIDYLLVMSQPLTVARSGVEYRYPLKVLSKAGAVKYELTSGPKGMAVAPTGLVTWTPAADAKPSTEHAIISISDKSSQGVFHTFAINVRRPGSELADASKPDTPKPKHPSDSDKSNPFKSGDPNNGDAGKSKPLSPTKSESKSTLKLPRPFDSVCVGGGGQYLVFHLGALNQIAIVDVIAGKIAKFLPLDEPNALVAAGADKLVVVFPESRTVKRFSFKTWKEERSAKLPGVFKPKAVVMGHASQGPLMIVGDNELPHPLHFINLATLKSIEVDFGRQPHLTGAGELHVRASANGGVFTMWRTGGSPAGLFVLQVSGRRGTFNYQHETVGYIAPNPSGSRVFTPGGVYTAQAKPIGEIQKRLAKYIPVPAIDGDYHLSIQRIDRDSETTPPTPKVSIYLNEIETPVATLTNIDVRPGNQDDFYGRIQLPLDKRIYFVPAASTIATLPESNDSVILHRIDLDGALEASGLDYLVVTSRPPTSVAVGTEMNYKIQAKSKRGGVRFELSSGAKGMKISSAGELQWTVPKDHALGDQQVLITIRDKADQTTFHSFRLTVTAALVAKPSAATVARTTEPKLRTWTDSTGKNTVRARFVKLEDGKVYLVREDGRKVTVPLESFSDADQKYVREQTTTQKPISPSLNQQPSSK